MGLRQRRRQFKGGAHSEVDCIRVGRGGFNRSDQCEAAAQRRTVTCYLPRSDPQCHGAKIEKEEIKGRVMKRRQCEANM